MVTAWHVRHATRETSLVVAVVVTLQVLFSHWWLSKFCTAQWNGCGVQLLIEAAKKN